MSFTILNLDTPLDVTKLLPIRWGSQGQAEQGVLSFIAGDADYIRIALDAAGNTALRNACAKVAGIKRDKSTKHEQVAVQANGRTTWKRLRKGESAGKRNTRMVEVLSYSPDARKAGVQAMRDTFGIALDIDPTVSSPNIGETVYVLRKVANVS